MTFENQYLTYAEYQDLGGTLEELPFNILELECRKRIDRRTQNRLTSEDEIPDEVKVCLYKMIENITSYQEGINKAQKGISSENIDGYSITYMSSNEIENALKEQDTQMEELVSVYLFGVVVNGEHILYLGVN